MVAVEAGDLDGGFVGFATGVAEKDFVHAGQCRQPFTERFLVLDFVDVGGVDELGGLRGQRLHELRVAMADADHGDACQRVEIALALFVP